MAVSENNVVTYGLKGKIGDLLVFKKQNGKTVVCKIATKSSVAPTLAQEAVKGRFRLASKFAKQAMQDPTLATAYKRLAKKGQSPFIAAFTDFFLAPELSNPQGVYDGILGTELMVNAIDNYEVAEVLITIAEADGTLIEQGVATMTMSGVDFTYSCATAFATPSGCKITWSAKDYAGNKTALEIVVE
jgi:hypothetical protein